METNMQKILAKADRRIKMKVFTGHFVTPHSHITRYLDMTTLKTRASEASAVAETLAQRYSMQTIVDTIVCLDNTEVIGAYLAAELTKSGIVSMNAHQTIYVIKPEIISGQIVFRDNYKPMLEKKNIFILMGTASTGESLENCYHSVLYHGGKVAGISAVFSAITKMDGIPIESIFSMQDIPNYASYKPNECPLCKQGQPINALVNGYGYSKLQ